MAARQYIPPVVDPSWRGHLRATLALGLPLIGVQLAQMSIHLTDTVMIGWLGVQDLGASVLGTQLLFVAFIISSGFANAVVPLAASAAAADDFRGVRRATRMGFWAVSAMSLALMPILWLAEPILLIFRQEPETAALAGDYVRIAQWGLWPMVLVSVLRSYMSALERVRIVLVAILCGAVVNAGLNYLLIFGHYGFPRLGIEGAAWASLATNAATLVVLVGYVKLRADLRAHGIFVRLWYPAWGYLREIGRTGMLIAIALWPRSGCSLPRRSWWAGWGPFRWQRTGSRCRSFRSSSWCHWDCHQPQPFEWGVP